MHNIVLVYFNISMFTGKAILRAFQGFLPWEDLGGPEKDREFALLVGLTFCCLSCRFQCLSCDALHISLLHCIVLRQCCMLLGTLRRVSGRWGQVLGVVCLQYLVQLPPP